MVAWLVLYAHFLWLAVAGKVGCGPDGDEVFRVLLGMVPFSIVCALLLKSTRPLADVHRILLWAGVPLFLLLPFNLMSVWKTAEGVWIENQAICSAMAPELWEQLWAPAQLAALSVTLFIIVQMWRSARAIGASG